MHNLLRKEIKLSASVLSYIFILFGLMFFLPGYPILCGAFFVSLGLFQSFQNAREANDLVFSALLPVAKKDVVKGKFLFSCMIEACGLLLMTAATVIRMTILSDAAVYRNNALMNANPFSLGMALILFGLFNSIFIGGFFKTGFRFIKPFVLYAIVTFITVGIGESLHYFPGLDVLNAFGFDQIALQAILLGNGIIIYLLLTFGSYRRSCRYFEQIDL